MSYHAIKFEKSPKKMKYFSNDKPNSIDIVFNKDDQNVGHALIRGPDENALWKGILLLLIQVNKVNFTIERCI